MTEKAREGRRGPGARGPQGRGVPAYSLADRREATRVHRVVVEGLEGLAVDALAVLGEGLAAKGSRGLTRAQGQEWGVRLRAAEAVLERLRLLVGSVGTTKATERARQAEIGKDDDAEAEPDDEGAIQELLGHLS